MDFCARFETGGEMYTREENGPEDVGLPECHGDDGVHARGPGAVFEHSEVPCQHEDGAPDIGVIEPAKEVEQRK